MSEKEINDKEKKKLSGKAKSIIAGGAAIGIASIVAAVSVVSLNSSNQDGEKNVGYTVSISSEFEGFEDTDLTISKGTKIKDLKKMITSPVPGYTVGGFYRDILCIDEYDDEELVTEDTKIFISFKVLTFTVKAYVDTSKTVLLEEKQVEYNKNANLKIPTKEPDKLAKEYEFAGWVDGMGRPADLSDIDRDMEVFANFRVVEYNQYNIAEIPSQVTITRGVGENLEILTEKNTLRYGARIKITRNVTEGYEETLFNVVGAIPVDGEDGWYEITGDGDLKVTYQEERLAFVVGELQQGVTILDAEGNTLTTNSQILYGDVIKINIEASVGYHITGVDIDGLFPLDGFTEGKHEYTVRGNVSIKFEEEINTTLVKYFDYDGSIIGSETVSHGGSISKADPTRQIDAKIGHYEFTGWKTKAGEDLTLSNMQILEHDQTIEAYASYRLVYNEYSLTIPDGVTITKDGTQLNENDTVHFGDELVVTYTLQEHYHLGEFKFNGDILSENGATIVVTGDVVITFVELQDEFSLTIPENVTVTRGGEILTQNSVLYFGDRLVVSFAVSDYHHFVSFKINGEDKDNNVEVVFDGNINIEFIEEVNKITINFVDFDNSSLGSEVVEHGKGITKTDPTRTVDQNIGYYKFLGWANENGDIVDLTNLVVDNHNETMVVVATYELVYEEYSLTIPENVTVTRDGETLTADSVLHYGDELTISYQESEGFKMKEFTVNGNSFVSGSTYTVVGDTSIIYTEVERTYVISIPNKNVSISTGNGGNIFDGDTVKHGDEIYITITANFGYHITGVYVNGEKISDGSSGTWVIKGEVNISYTEEKNEAAINFFNDDKTSITIVTAEHGDSLTVMIPSKTNPDPDYNYSFVGWVDGDGNEVDISSINIAEHKSSINLYAKFDAEYKYSYLEFAEITGGYEVVGFKENSSRSDVYIPATYLGKKVLGIKDNAFANNSNLKNITLPFGLIAIGQNAFNGCGLTSISIPNTVESIGEGAFVGCNNLASVEIRSGIIFNALTSKEACGGIIANATEIMVDKSVWSEDNSYINENFDIEEDGDFYLFTIPYEVEYTFVYEKYEEGYKLSYIDYPNVDWNTFDQNKITRLEIPDTYEGKPVLALGGGSISGLEGLKSVKLPANLRVIEESAFGNCKSLKSINLPNTLTTIGLSAFENTGLTSLVIPASVTTIETIPSSPFGNSGIIPDCKNLISLVVEAGNTVYTSRDASGNECNCIVEIASSTLIVGTSTTIIPSNVTAIGEYAFKGVNVQSLNLPSSLESIGNYAFQNSSGITNLEFSNKIIFIGTNAFENCADLKTVTIAGSITKISEGAFTSCKNLNSVILRDGVEEIGGEAFSSCENLETVILPSTLKTIGVNAFASCIMLRSIELNDGLVTISDYAFGGAGLTKIVIPESVEEIGAMAFNTCSYLTEAYIKANITELNGVFSYCSKLCYVELPETLTTIGSGEFTNTAFNEFRIPASVTKIDSGAFYDARIFTVIFEGDPNAITFDGYSPNGTGNSLYYYATTFKIPTQYDNGSFSFGDDSHTFVKSGEEGGYSIYTLVFGQEELMFVDNGEGGYIFSGINYNSKLHDIVIPDTYNGKPVVGVASNSIDMSKFSSITFGNNIKKLKKGAFLTGMNNALTKIYIPASLTEIEAGAIPFSDYYETIVVSPENPVYTSRDLSGNECNCVIEKATKTLLATTYAASTINCPTDGSVEILGEWFFAGCRLSDLIIPNCIKVIKANCFFDFNIQRLYISESVEVIEENAFNCTDNINCLIKKLSVSPDNKYYTSRDKAGNEGNCLVEISTKTLLFTAEYVGYMFDDGSIEVLAPYSFINQITVDYHNPISIDFALPAGLKKICGFALFGNGSLGSLTIPSSVTVIEEGAFAGINPNSIILEKINAGYTTKDLAGNECGCLIDINTKTLITVLDKENYYIPDDGLVENIGAYSLNGCYLKSEYDPETGSTNFENFALPSTIKKINKYGFAGANGLVSSITANFFNEGLEVIEDYAFVGCQLLNAVVLPSTLKYLSVKAFEGAMNQPTSLFIKSTEVYESLIFEYQEYNEQLGDYVTMQTPLCLINAIYVLKSVDTGTNETLKSVYKTVNENDEYYIYTKR